MKMVRYKFPLGLFLILEKATPVIYTSEVLTPNHYVCILQNSWRYPAAIVLKKELFFHMTTLIDISCIDTLNYTAIFENFNFFSKTNKFLLCDHYYTYTLKLRLSLFTGASKKTRKLISTELVFKNATWLEREVSEFFSHVYVLKKDSRNLLLDYSKNEYPLLKSFPCEGNQELYYDFFNQQLEYTTSSHVEL